MSTLRLPCIRDWLSQTRSVFTWGFLICIRNQPATAICFLGLWLPLIVAHILRDGEGGGGEGPHKHWSPVSELARYSLLEAPVLRGRYTAGRTRYYRCEIFCDVTRLRRHPLVAAAYVYVSFPEKWRRCDHNLFQYFWACWQILYVLTISTRGLTLEVPSKFPIFAFRYFSL